MKTTGKQSERDVQRLFPWFRDDLALGFRKSTDTYCSSGLTLNYKITILYIEKLAKENLKN